MKIAVNYTIFAIVSTIINICFQDISINVYRGEYAIAISVFWGTAAGLVVKYWLDKKYIFNYQTKNASHISKNFILYTAMGVVTTILFWGSEWFFHIVFETKSWRYFGGAIGLALGYIIKYRLDKKYVFVNY